MKADMKFNASKAQWEMNLNNSVWQGCAQYDSVDFRIFWSHFHLAEFTVRIVCDQFHPAPSHLRTVLKAEDIWNWKSLAITIHLAVNVITPFIEIVILKYKNVEQQNLLHDAFIFSI